MKRVFYISNSYDGAYFVITDSIEEYFERMAAYVVNLQRSSKLNHYSFGSIELSESDYLRMRTDASGLEGRLVSSKRPEPAADQAKKPDGPGLRLV